MCKPLEIHPGCCTLSVVCSFLSLITPFSEYTVYVYLYPVDGNLCCFQFRVVKSFFVLFCFTFLRSIPRRKLWGHRVAVCLVL